MDHKLKISGIIKESIVDGPGIRLVVFTQGCRHNCKGCHNPQTHSFDGGYFIEIDDILKQLKANPLLDGITLSGGEPFEQASKVAELALKAKEIGLNVMTYTGYTFEQIMEKIDYVRGWKELLYNSDILVDGRFEEKKKSLLLRFKGSTNQRIIDVKQSLDYSTIVLSDIDLAYNYSFAKLHV